MVGGTILAYWPTRQEPQVRQKLAWLVLIGWIIQGASGAGFGAISYAFYGKFPEIKLIAKAALFLKVLCTVIGFSLTAFYLRLGTIKTEVQNKQIWKGMSICAGTALSAAAFLRWFS